MILQALVKYYEDLERQEKLPKQGWCQAKVSYGINLSTDGDIKNILWLKEERQAGKKQIWISQTMKVPAMLTRSSGVAANFLCDNSKYMLGIDKSGTGKRITECFEAAKEKHLKLLENTSGEMSQAICAFFYKWNPEKAKENAAVLENWEEITDGGNLIFCMDKKYAQDDKEIEQIWNVESKQSETDISGICLVDPESGLGLVTDVCLKRKIRNYVETVKEDAQGYKIYIKEDVPLNRSDRTACENVGIKETDDKKVTEALKKLKKSDPDVDSKLRDYMCENYYDIRTFGAVMTTFVKASLNCGQVRGPVQLGFARSIDPVISQEVTITRVAITTEKDAENKSTEMGRKSIVPYALYRAEGFISANLARKTTGFTEEDLELLWDAIINMFENDHSAARGKMSVRELIVFKHSKELGDCPAYKLFDAVEVTRKENVEYPRRYQDYTVEIHNDKIPESVEVKRMI